PADAKKMLDAQKKSGKLLTIGYQNRYRQDSQVLKKMCEAGDLGDIYYARAQAIRRRGVPTWGVFPNKALQGGGPLIDIGTHSLDLTLWMMNNYEPKSVMGASFEKLGRLLKPGEQGNGFSTWDNEDYQVEDSAFGFVTMKNGAVITIDASWALNTLDQGEAITMLCGTKAGADMKDGLRINHIVYDKQTVTKPETATPQGVAFFEGAEVMSAEDFECNTWLDAVQGKGELIVKPSRPLSSLRFSMRSTSPPAPARPSTSTEAAPRITTELPAWAPFCTGSCGSGQAAPAYIKLKRSVSQ
ncbi:MAG: Gfo/Idh/MocA family protein, partial [Hydrogeniiclostridium mannosilyticum]